MCFPKQVLWGHCRDQEAKHKSVSFPTWPTCSGPRSEGVDVLFLAGEKWPRILPGREVPALGARLLGLGLLGLLVPSHFGLEVTSPSSSYKDSKCFCNPYMGGKPYAGGNQADGPVYLHGAPTGWVRGHLMKGNLLYCPIATRATAAALPSQSSCRCHSVFSPCCGRTDRSFLGGLSSQRCCWGGKQPQPCLRF